MGGTEEQSKYSVTFILFSGILFVVAIFISIACLVNSVHRVQEGNIAIYFKNGALLREISEPGVHMASRKLQTWKLIYHIDFTAFITTVLQITIRPETKYLNSMKCVTKEKSKNIRFTLHSSSN